MNLINEALMLTLIGMGMTFAAIGVLVLGMYAMTALIKDKPQAAEEPSEDELAGASEPLRELVADPQPLAAAAAVAVGLANQATPGRYVAAAAAVAAAMAVATAHPRSALSGATITWNAYVRRRTLALHKFYDMRRRPSSSRG